MSTGKKSLQRDRKLMDRLSPEPSYGRLLGVIATSYEMQPDFLETDFLPTVLGLAHWDDRNWTSRIALEKHLAELEAASFLIDAHPYRGRPRSLRVEIQPLALTKGRLLHAKMLVCVYEEAVRLIVGSANLTEPGYRRNLEVVAVLTATSKRPRDASLIRQAIRGFEELFADRISSSMASLCSLTVQQLDAWTSSSNSPVDQWFIWGGGNKPLWQEVLSRWPQSELIHRITIVSPFWSEEEKSGPLSKLLSELKAMGCLAPSVELNMLTEAAPDTQNTYKPRLPESFRVFDARPFGVNAYASAVDPRIPSHTNEADGDFIGSRALHAKIVLLEGESKCMAYLGSANFTNRGWGFIPKTESANIEAGLLLLRSGNADSSFQGLIPTTVGDRVSLAGAAGGKITAPDPSPDDIQWPDFLLGVQLEPANEAKDSLQLVLNIDPSLVAGPFQIAFPPSESNSTVLFRLELPDEILGEYRISLTETELARLLREQEVHVVWWECEAGRTYPINVSSEARLTLPISPLLGNPDEHNLIAYYQGKIAWEDLFPDPGDGDDIGTLQLLGDNEDQSVDTSRIQSYVVREFVEAIKGINDVLKSAAMSSKACMRLALIGSVSPVALARQVQAAVTKHHRSPMAAGFQLVEIHSCLSTARTYDTSKAFRKDWLSLVDEAAGAVSRMIDDLQQGYPDELSLAFKRYAKAIKKLHGADK